MTSKFYEFTINAEKIFLYPLLGHAYIFSRLSEIPMVADSEAARGPGALSLLIMVTLDEIVTYL